MLCVVVVLVDSASADVVFVVNSVLDPVDDDTGDGVCHTAANTCTLRAAVMQTSELGELGALQANGGWTETHALVAPSDMIDGSEPTVGCSDPNANPLTSDPRGGLRPTGTRCDLGAVENDTIPSGRIFEDDFESGNVWAW